MERVHAIDDLATPAGPLSIGDAGRLQDGLELGVDVHHGLEFTFLRRSLLFARKDKQVAAVARHGDAATDVLLGRCILTALLRLRRIDLDLAKEKDGTLAAGMFLGVGPEEVQISTSLLALFDIYLSFNHALQIGRSGSLHLVGLIRFALDDVGTERGRVGVEEGSGGRGRGGGHTTGDLGLRLHDGLGHLGDGGLLSLPGLQGGLEGGRHLGSHLGPGEAAAGRSRSCGGG